MTRSVGDAALMQNVTSGPHELDHDSLRARLRLPLDPDGIKGWKIAYSMDFGYVPVDADVRRNIMVALDVFKSLGCKVEEVDLGWTRDVDNLAMHWYNTMHFGRQTVWWKKTHADQMTDYALKMADAIEKSTSIDDVHKTWEIIHTMYQSLGPILARHDVFICADAQCAGGQGRP